MPLGTIFPIGFVSQEEPDNTDEDTEAQKWGLSQITLLLREEDRIISSGSRAPPL